MSPEMTATLWSRTEPSQEQCGKLQAFLEKRYGPTTLEWVRDESLKGGFRLRVGEDIYDWSVEGRLRQLQEKLRDLNPGREGIIPLIRETIETWDPAAAPQETGTVLTVGDEIATVSGLKNVRYGEILLFPGGIKGMVQDLRRESVGCVLFGSSQEIRAGDTVRRSGKTAGMPVGDAFLGRVVDALGQPIDGKGDIRASDYRPIEAPAPGILDRQPVDTPMETGLLAVDAMFPIGRGQRELIIGDRQTGKTAIALDTILNQKGKGVLCVYVAIGQKSSSVAQLVGNLSRRGAMDYTVVVNAPASAPASLQYIAPYAATALGEHFMYQGKDVLIVYDDLSKHAIAYRALSLLLERSPGREAYPALPPPGALRPPLGCPGRRQYDGPPHRGDPGGGRLRLHPHQRHLHHGRAALPGERALLLRPAARRQRGPLGLPGGRRRPDQGHEVLRRRPAPGSRPVPGDGGLHPVLQRPR